MFLISLMIFSLSFLSFSNVAKAQKISQTQMAGEVSVTIKVLPAEHFKGSSAEMKWDGGADPELSMDHQNLITILLHL